MSSKENKALESIKTIAKVKKDKQQNKLEKELEDIKNRLADCEEIAAQYKYLYKQLEAKFKALEDRHGNIQAVYDYMVKVGSSIAKHNPNGTAFLLPNDDPKRLKDN